MDSEDEAIVARYLKRVGRVCSVGLSNLDLYKEKEMRVVRRLEVIMGIGSSPWSRRVMRWEYGSGWEVRAVM